MKQRDTDKNKVVLTNNLQQRGASKLRREIEFVLIYQTKALQITEDDFHITNDRRKQRKNGVDNGKQFAKEIETLCQIAKKPNQIVSASSIFSKSLQKEISNI